MPTKTTLADLREHMFATIEALMDDEKPMDIERAKAIAEVGKRVIDSAKVEVDYMRVSGQAVGSRFFPEAAARPAAEVGDKKKQAIESPEAARRRKALFPNGELGGAS